MKDKKHMAIPSSAGPVPARTAGKDSPPAITWVEALNELAEVHSKQDLLSWVSGILSCRLHPSQEALNRFSGTIRFMRREIGKSYFGQDLDWTEINANLTNLRLVLLKTLPEHSRMPHMQVQWQGDDDDALLGVLEQTLFLQFANFLAESLQSSSAILVRCAGLFRSQIAPHGLEDEIEKKFRQEIPLLVEAELVEDTDIQRCGDLFLMRAKAKFCSDACRFTTFQITKQIKDPTYLAEKQRRYRQRLN